MSGDSNDADDYVPSGVTLIDTDADTDVDAFSLALYSRIYDIVDPDDPVDETDSNTSSNTSSNTIRELSPSSSEQQEPPPQPSTNQLPPTFVSRIREQLQASCPAPTADTPSPQSPPSPTSFLDIAEVQLQEYYDRVLTDEALCDAAVFRELSTEQLENAFCERYGQGLSEVEGQVKKLVHDAIADYQVYFEAEKDILEAAKRYDCLETWLKHTRDVFGKQGVAPTEEQTHELETELQAYMTNTPEWKQKFTDAQKKWNTLCTTRQALRSIHQLVGGTTGCRICFNKQVKTLLVPCGHVLCEDCANRVTCCPFCNTSFYARQEVFFI